MPSVQSSAIGRIEYDPRDATLTVWFHDSGPYTYFGVPQALYRSFLAAPSKGTFFNGQIRDRFAYQSGF